MGEHPVAIWTLDAFITVIIVCSDYGHCLRVNFLMDCYCLLLVAADFLATFRLVILRSFFLT